MKNRTFSSGPVRLENGTYKGSFSGYQVEVRIKPAIQIHPSHTLTVSFSTREGIRGIVQCKVIVKDGSAIVEW